jgi:hypothetical protein
MAFEPTRDRTQPLGTGAADSGQLHGDSEPLRLDGGFDGGAVRIGDTVERIAGPWTPAVHALLDHLARKGFTGAPRTLAIRADGVEQVTYLNGMAVGSARPWPAWIHSDQALRDVAKWLREYHDALADFLPPSDAFWREVHQEWGPGLVIAHNDAAPYNAVWANSRLVGFVDWDMAGPRQRDDDLIWVAFSWVPLHARKVVIAEGFTEFERRRERLAIFLGEYESDLTVPQVLSRLNELLNQQITLMHDKAQRGDATYQHMIDLGRDLDLRQAREELPHILIQELSSPQSEPVPGDPLEKVDPATFRRLK